MRRSTRALTIPPSSRRVASRSLPPQSIQSRYARCLRRNVDLNLVLSDTLSSKALKLNSKSSECHTTTRATGSTSSVGQCRGHMFRYAGLDSGGYSLRGHAPPVIRYDNGRELLSSSLDPQNFEVGSSEARKLEKSSTARRRGVALGACHHSCASPASTAMFSQVQPLSLELGIRRIPERGVQSTKAPIYTYSQCGSVSRIDAKD